MGIKEEIEKAEKEILSSKAGVAKRKEFWKTHTLRDSIYNEGGPKPGDIAQTSTDVLIRGGFSDCYLLAVLMNIAKTKPKFITDELIKFKDDNTVEVRFYKTVVKRITRTDKNFKLIFDTTGKKYVLEVKKEEVLKVIPQTYHKALWPLVIEIAYAKHIHENHHYVNWKNNLSELLSGFLYSLNELEQLEKFDFSYDIKREDKEKKVGCSDVHADNVETALQIIYKQGGYAALTSCEILGTPSKQYSIPENIFKGTKKFIKNKEYSENAKKIYDKIEKHIKVNHAVTASFKGLSKGDSQEFLHRLLLMLSTSPEQCLSLFTKKPTEWFLENKDKYKINIQLDESKLSSKDGQKELLKKLDDEDIMRYIKDCLDYSSDTVKIFEKLSSKTKKGIISGHAYAIVNCFEHEGYKYVVLQNPYDKVTKIDYSKSRKLPPEVKLPTEIEKTLSSKNQCIMELNHFCKHLASLGYNK